MIAAIVSVFVGILVNVYIIGAFVTVAALSTRQD